MNTATQILHNVIKAKLVNRSIDELKNDAKISRANKSDESHRMIFALTMDVLAEKLSEQEFETFYEEITNN